MQAHNKFHRNFNYKNITSASPAPEATSSSPVSGMNFVQNMFAQCPVSIECKRFLFEELHKLICRDSTKIEALMIF